jgi:hypothetical protein
MEYLLVFWLTVTNYNLKTYGQTAIASAVINGNADTCRRVGEALRLAHNGGGVSAGYRCEMVR